MIKLAYTKIKDKFPKLASVKLQWPRRRILQLFNFTIAATGIIILFKWWLYIHQVRLRSGPGHYENFHSLTFPRSLLDIDDFEWLSNNQSICELDKGTKWLLPILVFSARDHFSEREVIRKTYGSLSSYENWSIRVVFLLGASRNHYRDSTSSRISEEIQGHGDIITGNFVDSYRNLTYKHIMGYRWILEHCQKATFVWKVDDDIFLDPLSVTTWREKELKHNKDSSSKLIDFYCPLHEESEPQRDTNLKWYVPYELWPHRKYPTYCSGWGYGVSVDWIRKIFQESLGVRSIFWIDDMFITGILASRAASRTAVFPRRKNIWNYMTFRYDPRNTTFCQENDDDGNGDRSPRLFGVMGRLLRGNYLEKEMKCIWDRIQSKRWKVIDIS